jgi:hypothetical protein
LYCLLLLLLSDIKYLQVSLMKSVTGTSLYCLLLLLLSGYHLVVIEVDNTSLYQLLTSLKILVDILYHLVVIEIDNTTMVVHFKNKGALTAHVIFCFWNSSSLLSIVFTRIQVRHIPCRFSVLEDACIVYFYYYWVVENIYKYLYWSE